MGMVRRLRMCECWLWPKGGEGGGGGGEYEEGVHGGGNGDEGTDRHAGQHGECAEQPNPHRLQTPPDIAWSTVWPLKVPVPSEYS